MGGMGFIENNKALCMISVLINTHLLLAAKENKVGKYFSSSACAYNVNLQSNDDVIALRKAMHILQCQKMVTVGKNCLAKGCVITFMKIMVLMLKLPDTIMSMVPMELTTEEEKAPAALARKIIISKLKNIDEIEVWEMESKDLFCILMTVLMHHLNLFNSSLRGL